MAAAAFHTVPSRDGCVNVLVKLDGLLAAKSATECELTVPTLFHERPSYTPTSRATGTGLV